MNEKIRDIRERLDLSIKQFANLVDLKEKDVKNIEDNSKKPENDSLNKILEICNITLSELFNGEYTINIRKKIDVSKYKNIFNAYVENLKYYFGDKHIYVLSRHKKKNKWVSFIDILFRSSKSAVINEMKYFSPCYLVKNNISLLIIFENDIMCIYEIKKLLQEDKFEYNNYIYKIANEVSFK